jgi:hypothetical protein
LIGLINLNEKQTGERSAGNPHAAFDVAEAGNVTKIAGLSFIVKTMKFFAGNLWDARASLRPYLREPGGGTPPGYLPPANGGKLMVKGTVLLTKKNLPFCLE